MFEIKSVKSLLSENNFTQQTLADALQISKTTLNAKINGNRKWNYKELQKLRKVLNLSDEQFVSIFFGK